MRKKEFSLRLRGGAAEQTFIPDVPLEQHLWN